jgi:choline-sulfatase
MPARCLAALAVLAAGLSPAPAADPPRYNLIAVVTDDQALWTLGCYGNQEVKTPNMDRLAKEGAKFTNAFTVTPVCSPSRTTYMTGRHGIEFGVTDWISPKEHAAGVGLPANTPTWPLLLQKAGYKTALVGKWHLGGKPHNYPTACGFGHFFGELKGGFAPVDPVLERNGAPAPTKGYSSNVVTDEALRWVRANAAGPFALCLHFREPHAPYAPVPPEDAAVYKGLDLTIPDEKGLDREQVKRLTREYYAAVHAVDRNLGRVLDELEKLKVADRTIVTFTSDHGYNIGHHQIQHKGNGHWIAGGVRGPKRPNMWDTSLRVPLLVRWPGVVKPGTEIGQVVANTDMLPGVCGMLGVPVPAGVVHRGLDFAPLLRGETVPAWRTALFGAYDLHNGGLAYMRMARTAQWKLVRHYRCDGMDELYDLAGDPGETKNLYGTAKARAAQADLQARLDGWMKEVGDPRAK